MGPGQRRLPMEKSHSTTVPTSRGRVMEVETYFHFPPLVITNEQQACTMVYVLTTCLRSLKFPLGKRAGPTSLTTLWDV